MFQISVVFINTSMFETVSEPGEFVVGMDLVP
jgi:hypothetical protein